MKILDKIEQEELFEKKINKYTKEIIKIIYDASKEWDERLTIIAWVKHKIMNDLNEEILNEIEEKQSNKKN